MKRLIERGVAMALGLLLLAPMAAGAPHRPTGEFEPFDDCPLSRPTISDCIHSATNGGLIKIGKEAVPIEKPVTLQGGFEGSGGNVEFFGAESGDALSKTPQVVPGGLEGVVAPAWWPKSLQEWFNEQVEGGATGISATLELAAPATSIELSTENLLNAQGTALALPVRIKLSNPLLGSHCYLGSESQPIQLALTTGKDGAIEGSPGVTAFNGRYTLITINGGRLVNGTFAVPRANGCGGLFSFFVDPLVDSVLGLPSDSGRNSAVLEGKLQSAAAPSVRNSEKG